ncbi:unnamed protein product [Periconia digitata]|uniref:AB hydrolase-1 domain-containing protein n=1 Tax=Periconia digitata TaxID=1303443 RepID=A0A9W4U267_9PLEO|nr:unnamed protein product [Periconia digitata]
MKPTIVLVPGAWQLPSFFTPLSQAFTALGFPVVCRLPSSYPTASASAATPPILNPDTLFLREHVLQPLLDEGKEVVLLMHSYGGIYGPAALEGLARGARERNGLKGGVIACLYTAAFVARAGQSAMSAMGFSAGNLPPWIQHDDHAKVMLFHDLPDAEADSLAAALPQQPYECFAQPVQWDPYDDEAFRSRFGYIYTEADRILPMRVQQGFAKAGGIQHTIVLKGASHSPHIEMPHRLAETAVSMLETLAA